MSEPEFGPMVTERLGNREVTFPEWCKVSAYRQLPSGHVATFTATEYWVENYAIKGGKEQDQSPNAMWSKRVRGQIEQSQGRLRQLSSLVDLATIRSTASRAR